MTILNEQKIKKYCKKYGYGFRYFHSIAIITTGVDEWRLEAVQTVENGELIDKILVKHINKVGNRSGKMQFHTQRYAYDLDYVFTNIITPHETYNKVYSKAFRIKEHNR